MNKPLYKKKAALRLTAAALILLAVIWRLAAGSDLASFTSEEYAVSFEYPRVWEAISADASSFSGDSGFIELSAMSGEGHTLKEASAIIASHALQPYGSAPVVSAMNIQGHEASLIMPSSDQGEEWGHKASLVIQYPEARHIGGSVYRYFILTADREHIKSIGQTVRFKNQQGTYQ
ncbi:hypothetical protein [Paenibacillus sp. HW567]|uniref:hypothetical protein n=1 Tax=Paenibacillus sp. HW567 TaxID=1034769 RepID=UPI000380C970|nr:hypothetical protein [Paenibacillus sp. HW567]